MKVAKSSFRKRLARATLTVSVETNRKIDALRAGESRSAWVQQLIEREEARLERQRLVKTLRAQYTPAVCRQTLAISEEFSLHET